MAEDERIVCLAQAVTCSVLAPAGIFQCFSCSSFNLSILKKTNVLGPQRSRLLATLYKDERVRESSKLKEGGLFSILEKMYLDRVLRQLV
jgi:COP9 signalosome complex subunit 4